MDKKKMLLIYNPKSGKSQLKSQLNDIIELFTKNGYLVTVYPTQKAKDATEIVSNFASFYDLIVFSGGDGTVSEVISGLLNLENRPTIGYIPSGTVNDFATSLNISKDVMTSALAVIKGEPFAFDVGTFNEQVFSYIAAFGLFTDVSYQTPQETKNLLGRTAYIIEGIKRLNKIPSYNLTIKTDNETITGEFIYGMITNSNSIGGVLDLSAKNVKLDDGLFEVILARVPKNLADIQEILQFFANENPDPKYFYTCTTKTIEIHSEMSINWTLDGEFGGSCANAFIKNHKQAISIMVKK